MSPESEEKQKKRPLNRKFLFRALVICVFLLLLPFAGIQAYKQSLYFFYKGLWEQNYQGVYLIGYTDDTSQMEYQVANYTSDELFWQMVEEECLRNFGCEIVYNSQNYLPEMLYFNTASGYYIRMYELLDCTEA